MDGVGATGMKGQTMREFAAAFWAAPWGFRFYAFGVGFHGNGENAGIFGWRKVGLKNAGKV